MSQLFRLMSPPALGLVLAFGVAAGSPRAQVTPVAPPGDPVLARVDGEPITLSDLNAAIQELPEQLRATPPQRLYPVMLDQLITQRAIVNAARRAGLDRDEQVRVRVRRAEDQELSQALLTREVAGRVTDAQVRQAYDQQIASRPPEEEVRARHILVATEAEARAALAEVRGGADFATVATARSTDPGSRNGGDLGFFRRGDMIPEFAEAAFALQPGQITENPVRTQFGWHVIKVEERRRAEPPPFDEVKEQIRQQLFEREVGAAVERIRTAARVERTTPEGGTPRPTDNAEPPPPPAPPASGRPPQRR
jgi:peptidyl-prolyl cis-trans isomerase C